MSWVKKYRHIIIAALLAAIINTAVNIIAKQAGIIRPLYFLVPLGFLVVIIYLIAMAQTRGPQMGTWRPRNEYVVFMAVFVGFSAVVAQWRVLDWSSDLSIFNKPVPPTLLSPAWLGDWRYNFVQEGPPDDDRLIVIGIPSPTGLSLEQTRADVYSLIEAAARNDARGIAFDLVLEDESELDSELCEQIEELVRDDNDFRVFFGYTFEKHGDVFTRMFMSHTLEDCLPQSARGHTVGFIDHDRRIRRMPSFFLHDPKMPSLSLRIAAHMEGKKVEELTPPGRMLWFLEPSSHFRIWSMDELSGAHLRDRFILVGEDSPEHRFPLYFGSSDAVSGVLIHAYAVHSLRHQRYLQSGASWIPLLSIGILCLALALLDMHGVSVARLFGYSLLLAAGVALAAWLSVWLGNLWVDVDYPLAALWVFLGLIILLRLRKNRTAA